MTNTEKVVVHWAMNVPPIGQEPIFESSAGDKKTKVFFLLAGDDGRHSPRVPSTFCGLGICSSKWHSERSVDWGRPCVKKLTSSSCIGAFLLALLANESVIGGYKAKARPTKRLRDQQSP